MRFALILVLLTSLGCEKKTEEISTPGLEYRRFDPLVVSPEDFSRIKAICSALELKEDRLPELVTNEYAFSYAEKKCEDAALGAESEVKVKLERPDSNYIFRRHDGGTFAFPQVETSKVGALSSICENINDLKSPMQTSSKGAVWFTTFASTRYCASDYDSLCIHIQKGEHYAGLSYEIRSNEWIKFKVLDDKIGFFTERILISNADCGAGKFIERRARLK